jgi:regulator of protease activity HflC (stomatin/prohibitin superfamily)
MNKEKLLGGLTSIGVVVAIIVAVTTLFGGWSTINEGHRGVYVCWGERINKEPVQPGFHWKTPAVCGYTELNVRIQDGKISGASVKTSEGLNVKMDAVLRYRLDPTKVNKVYDHIGGRKAIAEKIKNSFQAALKRVADQYSDEELYKTKAAQYAQEVKTRLAKNTLGPLGFDVSHVLLANVNLPKSVEKAIARKTEMKHKKQEKQRAIKVERAEKKRKIVEAEGIAESNQIIGRSLSEEYLKWYWIQEGLKKGDAMYVPIGNDGLPIYKDVDSHPSKK